MEKNKNKQGKINIKHLINNNYFWLIVMFLINFGIMIAFNPKILSSYYLFAEDGEVFINGFLNKGLSSLFITYGGYFNFLSRIFAAISVTFARIFNSVAVLTMSQKLLSMIFSSFVCTYFVSDTFKSIIKSRTKRIAISLVSLVLISNFAWLFYNGVSIHWWCGILIFLISLNILNGELPSYKILPILLISILSSPSGLIIAFALGYYLLKKIDFKKSLKHNFEKYSKSEIIKILLLILALAVQSYAILFLTDVNTIVKPQLTIDRIGNLLYYSYLLSISSVNFLFGSLGYLRLANVGLNTIFGILLWISILYFAERNGKLKYFLFGLGSIFFLYFMINYKNDDFVTYYQEMISTSYQIWYHALPAIIAFFTFCICITSNSDFKTPVVQYAILLFVLISTITCVNHPELNTAKQLEKVSKYVDYSSKQYAYIKISPDFLNWYVTVPVKKEYCEVNDCGSKVQESSKISSSRRK